MTSTGTRATVDLPCHCAMRGHHTRELHVRNGRLSGRKSVESGRAAESIKRANAVLDANPEIRQENGRKNVKSGQAAEALKKARIVLAANPEIRRKVGLKYGRINVESGHLARVAKGVPSTADGILFRSQTEASFYCIVKELGGEPIYEPHVIELSDKTSYMPDFILGKPVLGIPANVLIELKPSRNAYYKGNLQKAISAGALIVYWDELGEKT